MKVRDIEIMIVKSDRVAEDALSKVGTVDEHAVRAACAAAIGSAKAQRLSSVTLPAFGTSAGFPLIGCAKIMSQEILRAGREAKEGDALKRIEIRVATDEALKLFEAQVYGYLRHVMDDLGWGPYVTTDIIIEVDGGIILIERTNPPYGWALPGGFVDRGESLETAARREAKEETAMDLEDLRQFHTYSDPSRDPRFHTVTAVFTAKGIGKPCAGDDAKGLKVVPFAALRKLAFAFDHNKVIEDYLRSRNM
jgi:ADP-ribose pyrophosphatase YjhB (NUDIX family)